MNLLLLSFICNIDNSKIVGNLKEKGFLWRLFCLTTPCMYLSTLTTFLKIYFRSKSDLKAIIKQCLRHQAVYSGPFHLITFCYWAFRGIKHFRRLVPISTTVNNSDLESVCRMNCSCRKTLWFWVFWSYGDSNRDKGYFINLFYFYDSRNEQSTINQNWLRNVQHLSVYL